MFRERFRVEEEAVDEEGEGKEGSVVDLREGRRGGSADEEANRSNNHLVDSDALPEEHKEAADTDSAA